MQHLNVSKFLFETSGVFLCSIELVYGSSLTPRRKKKERAYFTQLKLFMEENKKKYRIGEISDKKTILI